MPTKAQTLSPQTINFKAITTKLYSAADFTLGATASSALPVHYVSSNETVATVVNNDLSTAKIHIVGVGAVTITAQQGGDNLNYAAAADKPQSFTVTKGHLIVKIANRTKYYGGANPVFSISYSGFKAGESASNFISQPMANAVDGSNNLITASSLPGSYTIQFVTLPTGDVLNNYDTPTFTPGILTINKAPLKITSNVSKVYGAELPTLLPVTYTGFVNGDTKDNLATQATAHYDSSQPLPNQSSQAGTTYVLKFNPAAGLVLDNYDVTYPDGKFTITKASLKIAAPALSKVYGSSVPVPLAPVYTGFVNGDNEGIVTTSPTFKIIDKATSTPVNNFSPASSATSKYIITKDILAAGAVLNNYNVIYVDGTFTITKVPLNITVVNMDKNYGAANPTNYQYNYNGFLGTDNAGNSITTLPVATHAATLISGVNTTPTSYAIKATGAVAPNYSITYTTGYLTIHKAPLVVGIANTTKQYGASLPVFSFTYAGLIPADDLPTVNVFTTKPVATTMATKSSPVGQYDVVFSTAVVATARNYQITYASAPGKLTVTPVPLNIISTSRSKKYGGVNPVLTFTYLGLVNGDKSTMITTPPTAKLVDNTHIGTPVSAASPVTSLSQTYSIVNNTPAAGDVLNNYMVTYTNGTLTINPAPLKITSNVSKVYGAVLPATLRISYSGFVNGQTKANLTTQATAIYDHTQPLPNSLSPAGSTFVLKVSGAAGSVLDNYTVTYPDGKLKITKARLRVIPTNQVKNYGSPNPVFTFTYSGFVGSDNESSITTPPVITPSPADAEEVGVYPFTLSGGLANNYTFYIANSNTNGKLNIVRANLTIIADDKTKKYGEANPEFTITYSGFLDGDNVANSLTTLPTITTTPATNAPAGTYQINLSGAVSSKYNIVAYTPGTLTVTKADLTVTADNKSRKYGEANPQFTTSYSGFIPGDNADNSFTTAPAATTAAVINSSSGNYQINVSGGISPNYTLAYNPGNLIISKADLILTADDKARTYGAANPEFTAAYSGFFNGDNVANSFTTTPSVSTNATTSSSVGTYPINFTGGVSQNYNIVAYNAGTLTIGKADLTITADNKTRKYGEANPEFTSSYSGFINGDNAANSITSAPTLTATPANANSSVGTYQINFSGAVSPNYNIVSYNPGTLTITKAPLIIAADNKSRIYGAANPALTLTYNGFVGTDGPANLTGAAVATTAATLTSAAGTNYDINVNGAFSANYDIQYIKGLLIVGKAPLKITADNQFKTYGAANPALTFSYAGFVNNENAAALSIKPTATTVATASSNTGAYAITAAGGAAKNYDLVYDNGTLTINKAALTVKVDDQTRPYKTTDPIFAASYTGFVNGDTQASLTSAAIITTTATTNSSVGNYPITAGGAVSTNYTFNYLAGMLSITKGIRSIEFNNPLVKTYGDADFVPGATSTNNDAIVYTSSNAAAATVVQGKIHIIGAGSANLTASLPDDPNYFATASVSQLLTINKAQQTINFATIPAQNRGTTYDLSLVRSSSGLPVSFTTNDPRIALVDDQTLTALSIGKTYIVASQPGNSNYYAANNATQQITVQDAAGNEIIVRQAMSPNGDGINDKLYIEGINEHPNNRVTLLNRNGVKVFEVSGYDNVTKAFDGHSNFTGSMLQAGTYFYLVEYTQDGVGRHKTGYIVLKF